MPQSHFLRYWKILSRPYPFPGDNKQPLGSALGFGLAVFLMVGFLVMSGYQVTLYHRMLYGLLYGAACVVTILFNSWWLSRFSTYFSKRWSLVHHILWTIFNFLMVAIVNLVVSVLVGISNFSISNFLIFFAITLLIGSVPLTILLLYKQNRLLAEHLKAVSEIAPAPQPHTSSAPASILLKGSNEDNQLNLVFQDILFIEADRNYAKIYLGETPATPRTLRVTLSSLAQQLKTHGSFMRCHRAFIVNLTQIEKVEGNSQGLQLSIRQTSTKVPVSRSYIPELKNRMKQLA